MNTTQASTPPSEPPKPLNILCLDGGGVRGLSTLLILDDLMENLRTKSKLDTDPLPCEVFDLICGTSTGGLIAIMLGRLRMGVKDAIKCYVDFASDVFGRPVNLGQAQKVLDFIFYKSRGNAVYDASILKECVRKIASERANGDQDALLKDPLDGKDKLCRTFVVAVTQSYANAPPKLLRSYTTNSRQADTCKIWEAARATTAATTFFDPIEVGSPPETFIDGALSGDNNPARLARTEVHAVFPGRSIGCFLSIGTGSAKLVSIFARRDKIAQACAELVTNCDKVDHAVGKEFRKELEEGQANPYYRFQIDQGLQDISLDEWNQSRHLTDVTRGYLRQDKVASRADECVRTLMGKELVSVGGEAAELEEVESQLEEGLL